MNRKRLEKSLVHVYQSKNAKGMGFVVADERIVTVAHNIPRFPNRMLMPLGEPILVNVERVAGGGSFKALVEVAEVCGDVAVLSDSTVTGTDLPDYGTEYRAAMERIPALRVRLQPGGRDPIPVSVLTHDGQWLEGVATGRWIDLNDPSARILGGTSGSPVFDDKGAVVGMISSATEGRPDACMTTLADALPAGVLRSLSPGWRRRRQREAREAFANIRRLSVDVSTHE